MNDPLMQELQAGAETLFKAVNGQTVAELQCEYKIGPHGFRKVSYMAKVGERLNSSRMDLSRYAFGESPAQVVAELVETIQRDCIAEKIRVQHLKAFAAELGFDIVAKKKGNS